MEPAVLQRLSCILFAATMLAGCSTATPPDIAAPLTTTGDARATMLDETTVPGAAGTPAGAQPRLEADPAQLADDLVADDRVLHDPAAPELALTQAAGRQQAAYRAIGRHPEWDAVARARIPSAMLEVYDLNVDARRQLEALANATDSVPAWRIDAPAPAEELLNYYREAEAASGVGWNILAAINLIETRFGRINGVSTAGAQGPMQFMPSTFAAYGEGGDINSPHDSIMAAGRMLSANGFAADRDSAIYRYNNAEAYVRAVNDYAAVLAADPAAFTGYHRWEVYYPTTAGDVLLPVGFVATEPILAGEYLATHPQ